MPDKPPMPEWMTTVDLTHGPVCYGLQGPKSGPLLVLMHGISGNTFHFEPIIPALVAAGNRVLAFDFYGRGHSPGTPPSRSVVYNHELFAEQARELLEKLGLWRSLNLVGFSMGGAVAVHFASLYPDVVDKVALLAPAGLSAHVPITVNIMKIPLLGPCIESMVGASAFVKHIGMGFYDATKSADHIATSRFHLEWCAQHNPNYLPAVFSSVKYFPLSGMRASFDKLAALKKPTLILWGEKDVIVPTSSAEMVAGVLGARLYTVMKAGHMITYEQPEDVSGKLTEFFKA